jgi:hypothetical protein
MSSSNTEDIDKLREKAVEVATTSRDAHLQDLSNEARGVANSTKTFLAGLDKVLSSYSFETPFLFHISNTHCSLVHSTTDNRGRKAKRF